MRILLILRGAQGSGKTTFVKENKLEDFVLSQDKMRVALYGYERDGQKRFIPQRHNNAIYKLFLQTLEERMQDEEFLVIDNVNADISDIKKLCKKYKYRYFVKDFTDYQNIEEYKQLLFTRNLERGAKMVPEKVIEKTLNNLVSKKGKIKEDLFIDDLSEIYYRQYDFSKYDKVFICGDIHGNYRVLKKVVDMVRDQDALVLLGDYVDRGFENDLVVELLSSIANMDNVYLLTGNHEKWIKKHILGEEVRSPIYRRMTRPQIESIDGWRDKLKGIERKLLQCLYFKYPNKNGQADNYFLSHAGVGYWDERIINYSKRELVDGRDNPDIKASMYNEAVDSLGIEVPYQIHGHISFSDNVVKNGMVYNLNSRLEFGGDMPLMILSKDNDPEIVHLADSYDYPEDDLNKKYIFLLNASRDINVKDNENGIESYNFTKETFRKRSWNNLNVLARGLFWDPKDEKVVARSYDKFFNYGELSDDLEDYHGMDRESRIAAELEDWINIHKDKIAYPVQFYRKENGFLGLITLYKDKLLFCSKSTSIFEDEDNEFKTFPKILRDIASPYKEKIREELIKLNSSGKTHTMIFEVIDPERDPHLISYPSAQIFLLDIVENFIGEFRNKPYEDILTISNKIGIDAKTNTFAASNFNEMQDMVDYVRNSGNVHNEGVVCVDKNNFMFKVKSPFYLDRKAKRSVIENYIKSISNKKREFYIVPSVPKDKIKDFKTFVISHSLSELESTSALDLIIEFEEEYQMLL